MGRITGILCVAAMSHREGEPSKRVCIDDQQSFSYSFFTLERKETDISIKEGVAEMGASIVIVVSQDRLYVANREEKRLLKANEVDLSGMKHNQIVDLSVEGDRWEGDALNDEPYGWGVLYDNNNGVVYEGFRVGEMNLCYGRRYYADIARIEYEGEFCDGKRWGKGVQYDRNGDVVFEGEWRNDKHVSRDKLKVAMTDNSLLLHNRIERLVVSCDHSLNGDSWNQLLACLKNSLREIIVQEIRSKEIKKCWFVDMRVLESIRIDCMCFNYCESFRLKNCPKVKELKIGELSFADCKECEIENVDALEVIAIGKLHEKSSNFCASLVLNSLTLHMVVTTRLAFAQKGLIRRRSVPLLFSYRIRE